MQDRLSAQHVVRFFNRMAHLYAHKWISVYGDATKPNGELSASAQQWFFDLRDYAPDQVLRGMQIVEKRSPEWPPGPLDFKRMCDGVPTLEEVLDRHNDYGPVCAKIRTRLDWYNLDGMTSKQMHDAADRQYRSAVTSLGNDGTIARISANAAIEARREAEAVTDETDE